MKQIVDATKCPLCKQDNNCLNEQCGGTLESGCWCSGPDIHFPQGLLKKIPLDQKQKACVCKSCVTAFDQTEGNE